MDGAGGAHVVIRISAGQMFARPSLHVELGGLSAGDTEEALRVIAREVAEPLAQAIGITRPLMRELTNTEVDKLADAIRDVQEHGDEARVLVGEPVKYAEVQHEAGTELKSVGNGGLVYVALKDDDEPPGTDRVAIVADAETASRAYSWLGAQRLPRHYGTTVRGAMYPQVGELADFETLVREYVDDALYRDDLHAESDACARIVAHERAHPPAEVGDAS